MAFDDRSLDSYVDVNQRLADFREMYPAGCLQPADPAKPWEIAYVSSLVCTKCVGRRSIKAGRDWKTCPRCEGSGVRSEAEGTTDTLIVYTAAAYRTPDDPRPGIGIAWEVYPGRTPYTYGSELMNAETSAWGRAIVAVLASDSKAGVASREEVRNRRMERGADDIEVDEYGAMTFAEQTRLTTGMVPETDPPPDETWHAVDANGERQPSGKLPKEPGPQAPKPVETDLQKRMRNVAAMQGYFRTLGVVDRQAYLHIAATLAGVPKIKTTKDLTVPQGREVIAALAKCKDGAALQGLMEERERELADLAPA